jgi:2-hydroxy-3-oxopropionate reductase
MSTIAPATARALAAEARGLGAGFLDAPVSGGTVGARAGTLTIMVGGEESVLDRVRPILERLGSQITLIGSVGAGQVAKAANQLVVGGTIGLVAKALTLAERLGADPARVAEALSGGFAASRVLEVHGGRMLERSFEPGFRCALQNKDLGIVSAAAEESGLQFGLATAARELFQRQCDAGGGDLDHSAAIDAVRHA